MRRPATFPDQKWRPIRVQSGTTSPIADGIYSFMAIVDPARATAAIHDFIGAKRSEHDFQNVEAARRPLAQIRGGVLARSRPQSEPCIRCVGRFRTPLHVKKTHGAADLEQGSDSISTDRARELRVRQQRLPHQPAANGSANILYWNFESAGSPGWIRTSDHSINSRMLYR